MEFDKWIRQAKGLSSAALSAATETLGAGAGYVRSAVDGGLSLFGSTESSDSYSDELVDEKHYFLVPDRRTDQGFSLYVMRCLPDDVPPINDLPKHRVLHLSSPHAEARLKHMVLAEARRAAEDEGPTPGALSGRLDDLVDQIDHIDDRVFHGVLLIGGLVALVNPVAGAAVALKALMPSLGLLVSRHGMEAASEALSERELAARVKQSEREVLAQFRGAETVRLVNPILESLAERLRDDRDDVALSLEFEVQHMSVLDQERLRVLTCQALSNTYADVLDKDKHWKAAGLDEEAVIALRRLRNASEGR